MVEENAHPLKQDADGPQAADPASRDKQFLNGPLAAGIQAHRAGIGMGLVGLLLGALTASPLIAAIGLLGGVTAGTLFFDGRRGQSNPIAQNLDKTLGPFRRDSEGPDPAEQQPGIAPSPAPQVLRKVHAPDPLSVTDRIALDQSFQASEPLNPRPTGNLHRPRRKTI